jgi:hypothetical protein
MFSILQPGLIYYQSVVNNPSPLIPAMTSNTTPNGIVSAGGNWRWQWPTIEAYNASSAFLPFDGSDSTGLQGLNDNLYLIYQFPSSKLVTGLQLLSYENGDITVSLQGSTDGIIYHDIGDSPYIISDPVINGTIWPHNYTFYNTTPYLYYKITFAAPDSTVRVTRIQLYGMEIF